MTVKTNKIHGKITSNFPLTHNGLDFGFFVRSINNERTVHFR